MNKVKTMVKLLLAVIVALAVIGFIVNPGNASADFQGTTAVGVNKSFFKVSGVEINSSNPVTISAGGSAVYTDRMVISKSKDHALWIDVDFTGSIGGSPGYEIQCRPLGPASSTWVSFDPAVSATFSADYSKVKAISLPVCHEIRLKLIGDSSASTEFTNVMLIRQ